MMTQPDRGGFVLPDTRLWAWPQKGRRPELGRRWTPPAAFCGWI